MRTALIGLGNMGVPMVRNLLKTGHALSVLDSDTQAVGIPVEADAMAAVSPKDAVTGTETVIAMLSAVAHVRHALTVEDGVPAGIAKGVPIIDSSTIDLTSIKAFGAMATEHDSPFVDTPVLGDMGGVAAGTLTFMVGGSVATFEQMCLALSTMSKNSVYRGDTDARQGAKICNNFVLGIMMAGVAEAMSLEKALGTDPKVPGGIINTSTGHCWSSDTYDPFLGVIDAALSSRGCMGGFDTDLTLKDLGLAGDTTKSARQPVYLGVLVQQLYQTVSNKGGDKLDFSAVVKLYWKDGTAR